MTRLPQTAGGGTRLARCILRWSQCLCLVVGLGALGWCVFVTADARWTQASFSRSLARARQGAPPPPQRSPEERPGAPENSLVGRIDIAAVGMSAMVLEGDDARALSSGVGHIRGTALPGNSGNVGLAGHRDTFFRTLKNIRLGDDILVTTPRGCYRYRVVSSEIVSPDETRVLDASAIPSLTLVTCYPFHIIGSAPKRFIVRANMVRS